MEILGTGLKINSFIPVCQDVRCDVNLVGHMSDTKCLKWTEYFSQKNFLFNKII